MDSRIIFASKTNQACLSKIARICCFLRTPGGNHYRYICTSTVMVYSCRCRGYFWREGKSDMKKIMLLAAIWMLSFSLTGCQSCRLWPSRNDAGSTPVYAAPVSVPVYDAPASPSGGCGPGCTSCKGPQVPPSLQVAVPGYTPVLGQ